jgi:uncharacterized membrane protein
MFREIKKISNNILFINLGILGLVTFIIIIYLVLSNYIHDMSFFTFIGLYIPIFLAIMTIEMILLTIFFNCYRICCKKNIILPVSQEV